MQHGSSDIRNSGKHPKYFSKYASDKEQQLQQSWEKILAFRDLPEEKQTAPHVICGLDTESKLNTQYSRIYS